MEPQTALFIVFVLFEAAGFLLTVFFYLMAASFLRPGYGRYFWMGVWLLNPASVYPEGQYYRRASLLAIALFGGGTILFVEFMGGP
ncbi:hypothetical protein C8D92_110138 [Tamilnaduibacter salinus]|uniref:Uncharacterized protein n=1 Tax=Tamilnaduibacter salinus TaxID=1484056 RepID=A0A2U1CTT2_9GAMM|nr:hypothetical protein C8D92_110138 [Tamilnaduibacter salinus]